MPRLLLSDALADILGKPKGTIMPELDLYREMVAYTYIHDLVREDDAHGDLISPNDDLQRLFGTRDRFTFVTFGMYLRPFFSRVD
jgi:chromatin remodeling complex protein RSC6